MNSTSIFCTLFLLSIFYDVMAKNINNRPIIGVLAQHFHPVNPFPGVPGNSYIAASYVKFLEAAGARVVPIRIDQKPEDLQKILSSVNGVLFPGGDSYVLDSPYQRSAEAAFKYALSEANNGNYYPIWGTCLGMQQLSTLVAQTDTILSPSKGTWDVSMHLENISTSSRMMENIPNDIMEILNKEQVTYNVHYNCVSVDAYKENGRLHEFFHVVSTNVASDGQKFLSTIEGMRIQTLLL